MQTTFKIDKYLLSAFLAYFLWGIFPIYWKSLSFLPQEILCLRFILSFLTCIFLIFLNKNLIQFVKEIFDFKVLALHFISGSLLACNWYVYTWSVLNDKTIEASLGYFITPILITLSGILFYGEKISKTQSFGIITVVSSILLMIGFFGYIPYIAFTLTFTFSIYSFLRKKVKIKSLNAFCLESLLMSPFAITYLLVTQNTFQKVVNLDNTQLILVLIMGVVTATPLVLFGFSAKKVEFKTLGLLQYLAPILQFLVGLLLFNEKLQLAYKYSLPILFIGLIIYASDYFKKEDLSKRVKQ
ncbi:MAG: protein RarD [Candidatus Cloacimonadota bacterium]|nr:MAG: protein RarD [Candidatus Cloacimonadota bacterium]